VSIRKLQLFKKYHESVHFKLLIFGAVC